MQLHDLRIFTEPQQGADYGTLLAVAQRAEQLGFGAFFRSDHYLAMGDASGLPGPTDAWITLAGLARDTSTIRLGTLVSPVTFRAPGLLAISVAQVDAMTRRRVPISWFRLGDDPGLARFLDGMARRNGGRVLAVTAIGPTLAEAKARAYQGVDAIEFADGFHRRDIGWRELERRA